MVNERETHLVPSGDRPPEEPLTPGEALGVVLRHGVRVAAVTAAALALAGAYLLVTPRTWRAGALVRAQQERARAMPGFEEVSEAFMDSTPADLDLELLRSRAALEPVVDELGLDVSARPERVPLVGAAVARLGLGARVPPWPALAPYAWGGERIEVARLEVPPALVGVPLALVALGDGRFRIDGPDGAELLRGTVGAVARGEARAGPVEVDVVALQARAGQRFRLERVPRERVLGSLERALRVEERGKRTGLLAITLDGPEPERTAGIVNAIAQNYVRREAARFEDLSKRTLAFFESQLPPLRAAVERAEVAYEAQRRDTGMVDVPTQSASTLGRAAELDRSIADLEAQKAELAQRYSPIHPNMIDLERKLAAMRGLRTSQDQRVRALPASQLQSVRLERDLRLSTELYLSMLDRTQRVRLVTIGGAIGGARIVDPATVPTEPIAPNPGATLAFALLLGLGGGAAAALARRREVTVGEPAEVEAALGVPVVATVPYSRGEATLARRLGRRAQPRPSTLSLTRPGDLAVEDLRNLRTFVQATLPGARTNLVAITGPSPRVGKSFVCVNLASLLAATRRRVLVVDADLRRGELHRRLGVAPGPGLAEVLAGEVTVSAAIARTGTPGLDVLPAGRVPADPAELLGRSELQAMLEEVRQRYDAVLVDTPAVLAVTDAAVVARLAGVTLMVVRAGETQAAEIALSAQRLAHAGGTVHGAILNGVRAGGAFMGRMRRYRRYARRAGSRSA